MLPVVEVMLVGRSGACETGFVGEENILQIFPHIHVLAAGTNVQTVQDGGNWSEADPALF